MALGGPRSRILERYVLSGERVVIATRHHWGMLVEPVATAVAGALVIGWLVVQAGPAVGDGVLVLWWLWLVLAARLVWKVFEWRNEWFVATDKRLLLLYGLITHKVAMMPLTKVTDMNYGRSLLGRFLGYGQFLLESAGQDQALRQIDWVSRPDATYRKLCDTLFGPGGAAGRPGFPSPAATQQPPTSATPSTPETNASRRPTEPPPVPPAPAWDGRTPSDVAPVPPVPPAPARGDGQVVVVPGRAGPVDHAGRTVGRSSGATQPIEVRGNHEAEHHEDERGWAVSGEHRATYVPVVHPRPIATPVPKPYEPGPGRDEAP